VSSLRLSLCSWVDGGRGEEKIFNHCKNDLKVLEDYDNVHFYSAKLLLSPCVAVASGGRETEQRDRGWRHLEAALSRQPFRDTFNREAALIRALEGDAHAAREHFRR
jgi:hypothetical protein